MKKGSIFVLLLGLIAGYASIAFAENGQQPDTRDEDIRDSDKRKQPGYQPVQKCVQRCDANGQNCWTDCDN